MCTLSFRRPSAGIGYELWFNRDEKHARAPESPPRLAETAEGVRHVAPLDGEHGGTWLMLNERGVTVCVLNDYEAESRAPGIESRGRLPLLCAGCSDAAEVMVVLRAVEASRFAPFRLVAVGMTGPACLAHWDGRWWRESEASSFLTSSSWRPAQVRKAREARHAALAGRDGLSATGQAAMHWTHDPQRGAESILMRRADACTRSVCRVRVGANGERVLMYSAVDWATPGGWGGWVEVSL